MMARHGYAQVRTDGSEKWRKRYVELTLGGFLKCYPSAFPRTEARVKGLADLTLMNGEVLEDAEITLTFTASETLAADPSVTIAGVSVTPVTCDDTTHVCSAVHTQQQRGPR